MLSYAGFSKKKALVYILTMLTIYIDGYKVLNVKFLMSIGPMSASHES